MPDKMYSHRAKFPLIFDVQGSSDVPLPFQQQTANTRQTTHCTKHNKRKSWIRRPPCCFSFNPVGTSLFALVSERFNLKHFIFDFDGCFIFLLKFVPMFPCVFMQCFQDVGSTRLNKTILAVYVGNTVKVPSPSVCHRRQTLEICL